MKHPFYILFFILAQQNMKFLFQLSFHLPGNPLFFSFKILSLKHFLIGLSLLMTADHHGDQQYIFQVLPVFDHSRQFTLIPYDIFHSKVTCRHHIEISVLFHPLCKRIRHIPFSPQPLIESGFICMIQKNIDHQRILLDLTACEQDSLPLFLDQVKIVHT